MPLYCRGEQYNTIGNPTKQSNSSPGTIIGQARKIQLKIWVTSKNEAFLRGAEQAILA
jgi:hypothetical protein